MWGKKITANAAGVSYFYRERWERERERERVKETEGGREVGRERERERKAGSSKVLLGKVPHTKAKKNDILTWEFLKSQNKLLNFIPHSFLPCPTFQITNVGKFGC